MPNNALKFRLSQYGDLQHEIRMHEDHLQNLRERLFQKNHSLKNDSVQGSRRCEPYDLHSISIAGLEDDELAQKAAIRMEISDIKHQIRKKQEQCIHEYKQLNKFILSVDDSRMRQILTLKYIDGKSFQQIAFAIGEHDEQKPRKWLRDFLENTKNTN